MWGLITSRRPDSLPTCTNIYVKGQVSRLPHIVQGRSWCSTESLHTNTSPPVIPYSLLSPSAMAPNLRHLFILARFASYTAFGTGHSPLQSLPQLRISRPNDDFLSLWQIHLRFFNYYRSWGRRPSRMWKWPPICHHHDTTNLPCWPPTPILSTIDHRPPHDSEISCTHASWTRFITVSGLITL